MVTYYIYLKINKIIRRLLMSLKNLVKKEIVNTVNYPRFEDFKVTVRYMGREQMREIYEGCMKMVYNPQTKQREKEMDNKKLQDYIAKNILINWVGLNYEMLAKIAPIAIPEGTDPLALVEPTLDNKKDLLEISAEFDNWLSETIKEYENFEGEKKAKELENLK